MSRFSALMTAPAPWLGFASASTALNFTRMLLTASRLVPVRSATSSSALMFSTVLPVASATSLSASTAFSVVRAKLLRAPTDKPATSPATPLRKVAAPALRPPRLLLKLANAALLRSSADRMTRASLRDVAMGWALWFRRSGVAGGQALANVREQLEHLRPVGHRIESGVERQPLGRPACTPLPAVQRFGRSGQQIGRRGHQVAKTLLPQFLRLGLGEFPVEAQR